MLTLLFSFCRYGAFGTPEKPVIVKSVFDTRITGCVGGEGSEHALTWHVVSHGKPLVCLECGQVFQVRMCFCKIQVLELIDGFE